MVCAQRLENIVPLYLVQRSAMVHSSLPAAGGLCNGDRGGTLACKLHRAADRECRLVPAYLKLYLLSDGACCLILLHLKAYGAGQP